MKLEATFPLGWFRRVSEENGSGFVVTERNRKRELGVNWKAQQQQKKGKKGEKVNYFS